MSSCQNCAGPVCVERISQWLKNNQKISLQSPAEKKKDKSILTLPKA